MTFEQFVLIALAAIILCLVWINHYEYRANRKERELLIRMIKAESLQDYDNLQRPVKKRDNWLKRSIEKRNRPREIEVEDDEV